MIPEAGAGGSVELYRAENFPNGWVKEGNLLEGVAGYDATITKHEGLLWMFLSTECWQSTSWDNLNLYYADHLLGDWQPHAKNPVLVDGHASRPGGEMFAQNGELLRPAQDGSAMYGGALTLCRIDRLDREEFAQTAVGSVTTTAPDSAYGVHTINRCGNIEVVDILGRMEPDSAQSAVIYQPASQRVRAAE